MTNGHDSAPLRGDSGIFCLYLLTFFVAVSPLPQRTQPDKGKLIEVAQEDLLYPASPELPPPRPGRDNSNKNGDEESDNHPLGLL